MGLRWNSSLFSLIVQLFHGGLPLHHQYYPSWFLYWFQLLIYIYIYLNFNLIYNMIFFLCQKAFGMLAQIFNSIFFFFCYNSGSFNCSSILLCFKSCFKNIICFSFMFLICLEMTLISWNMKMYFNMLISLVIDGKINLNKKFFLTISVLIPSFIFLKDQVMIKMNFLILS
jgi:hypothetical protein